MMQIVNPSLKFLIFSVIAICCCYIAEGNKKQLYLGYFISKNVTNGNFVSYGTLHAAQMAIEYVNNEEALLEDYKLNLISVENETAFDSKCERTAAIDAYFSFWTSEDYTPKAPLFLGGGCSVAVEPMAELSKFWKTVQVTFSSITPVVINRDIYPFHFGLLPRVYKIHFSQVQMVKQYSHIWKEVAVVAQNENLFQYTLDEVEGYLKREPNAVQTVRVYRFLSELPLEGLDSLWDNPPRVIIVNAYQGLIREFFCQAYKRGIYYPNNQIITSGWYDDSAWNNRNLIEGYTSECGLKEIQVAINNALAFSSERNSNEPNRTVDYTNTHFTLLWLHQTAGKIKSMYEVSIPNKETINAMAMPAFDAVLTAAMALNKSIAPLEAMNLSLESFNFLNHDISEKMARVIHDKLANEVTFVGASGNVSFNRTTGDRLGVRTLITQYRTQNENISRSLVAYDVTCSNPDYCRIIFLPNVDSLFPDGIPQDEISQINVYLFAVSIVLACLGIILAVVCLLFNSLFMNKKYVKLTSPLINVIMCIGAILLYVEMVIIGIEKNLIIMTAMCNVALWIASIGFTLLFGPLLLKTWRIYYIYRLVNKASKMQLSDWFLMLIISILLAVDVVFMTIITAVPESRQTAKFEVHPGSRDLDLFCTAENNIPVLIVLFAYKAIYLIIGVFLAFENRKVNIKALNDSRYIAAAVYCAVVMCIPLVPIGILHTFNKDARFAILSLGIFLSVTAILSLLFIPRMIGLYHIRKDNTIETALNSTDNLKQSGSQNNTNHMLIKITNLEDEVKALTNALRKYEDVDHEEKNEH